MMNNLNRHLQLRGRKWYYRRRVPHDVSQNDSRSPSVKIALKTPSLQEARQKRDRLEVADDAMWSALRAGFAAESANERYDAAMGLEALTGLASPLEPLEFKAFTHLIARDIEVGGPINKKMDDFLSRSSDRRSELYDDMDDCPSSGIYRQMSAYIKREFGSSVC